MFKKPTTKSQGNGSVSQAKTIKCGYWTIRLCHSTSGMQCTSGWSYNSSDARVRTQLKDEMTNLSKLQHPNFVRVIDAYSEVKSMPHITTECIKGNLQSLMPFSRLQMQCGLWQVANGLSYLHHSHRRIHGNVSPETILVTHNCHWKLCGLSHYLHIGVSVPADYSIAHATTSHKIRLDYSPPELEDRQNSLAICAEYDVWSLGAVIYFLFSKGRHLFDVKDGLRMWRASVTDAPSIAATLGDQMEPLLKDTLQKMLSPKPSNRPTASMFALNAYFAEPPVTCMLSLNGMDDMDHAKRVTLLAKTLTDILHEIPEKECNSRILPILSTTIANSPELRAACARPICRMLTICQADNLARVQPLLRSLIDFATVNDAALTCTLIERSPSALTRLGDRAAVQAMLQLAVRALKSTNEQMILAALDSISKMPYVTQTFVELQLLPELTHLLNDEKSSQAHIHVIIIGLFESILPLLTSVSISVLMRLMLKLTSNKPFIAVSIINLYANIVENMDRLLLTPTTIAKDILPEMLHHSLTTRDSAHFSEGMRYIRHVIGVYDYNCDSGGSTTHEDMNSSQSFYSTTGVPSVFVQSPEDMHHLNSHSSSTPSRRPSATSSLNEYHLNSIADASRRSSCFSATSSSQGHASNTNLFRKERSTSETDTMMHMHIYPNDSVRRGSFNPPKGDEGSRPIIERRASSNIPSAPSSFTNLAHNVICTLWTDKSPKS